MGVRYGRVVGCCRGGDACEWLAARYSARYSSRARAWPARQAPGVHAHARGSRRDHAVEDPGLFIPVAAELSLLLVVQWWLQVPIAGSTLLFLGGACFYVFTVAALGILLGTIAATMGQFRLLAIPVLLVMMLLRAARRPWKASRSGCSTSCRSSARPRISSLSRKPSSIAAPTFPSSGPDRGDRWRLFCLRAEPLPPRNLWRLNQQEKAANATQLCCDRTGGHKGFGGRKHSE
jgi:hypothetical protein